MQCWIICNIRATPVQFQKVLVFKHTETQNQKPGIIIIGLRVFSVCACYNPTLHKFTKISLICLILQSAFSLCVTLSRAAVNCCQLILLHQWRKTLNVSEQHTKGVLFLNKYVFESVSKWFNDSIIIHKRSMVYRCNRMKRSRKNSHHNLSEVCKH